MSRRSRGAAEFGGGPVKLVFAKLPKTQIVGEQILMISNCNDNLTANGNNEGIDHDNDVS